MRKHPKSIALQDWPGLLRPGMRVFVHGGIAEPVALREALAAQPDAARDIAWTMSIVPGVNGFDYSALGQGGSLTTNFVTPSLHAAFAAGRLRFMPLNYHGFHDYLSHLPPFDLVLLHLSPSDPLARHSPGVSADFPTAVLPKAKAVLGLINAEMPFIGDGPMIDAARLSWQVRVDADLPAFPSGAPDATQQAIARHAADLVRDGDCIQIGIGKIQTAILGALRSHRRLGFHSGLITDAVIDLIECGALNGQDKSRDRSLAITGLAVGSRRLYQALKPHNISFRAADFTHNARILAEIDNFFSINSAIEVDLFGQCNAEGLDGRQVSGTGGFADFVRGARLSRGGRSIVALPASAAGGTVSRIRPALERGMAVTGARSDTDFIVTEFGVAALRDKSLDERARALIGIAAPPFREELERAWFDLRRQL